MRRVLKPILFVVVTLAISAALIELGLRVLGYHPLTTDSTVWESHPRLGWWHRPGATEIFRRIGFQQHIEINSKGLREREISYENPDKTPRILLLGDSVTVGFEVPMEQVFGRVMEDLFAARGIEVEVINAGCRGWGSGQSLILLREEAIKYQPDLVLFFWIGNDVQNDMTIHKHYRKFGKSYFVLGDDGTLALRGVPVPEFPYSQSIQLNEFGEPGEVPVDSLTNLRLWFRDATAGSSALAAATLHALAGAPGLLERLRGMGSTGKTIAAPLPHDEPESDLRASYSYRLQRALVKEMQAVATAAGAGFHLIGHSSGKPFALAMKEDLGLIDLGDRTIWKRLAAEHEGRIYVPFDSHWNELGHRLYAQALTQSLIASELVPTSVSE